MTEAGVGEALVTRAGDVPSPGDGPLPPFTPPSRVPPSAGSPQGAVPPPLPPLGTPAGRPAAPPAPPVPSRAEATQIGLAVWSNLQQVLLGTPRAVAVAVTAVLSGSHLLVEDVPGVGKTILARAIAVSLGVELSRIQGHPDLLPSDVTGVSVYAQESRLWEFRPGPVFGHVVLVDEMNRTPPRTQSALLEAMEERQVTVDGQSWPLPEPHLVVATQNPVGQLGTYPLVESQLDRFGLSMTIGYPDAATETHLVLHEGGRYALDRLGQVATPAQWERAIAATATVHVDPAVAEFAVTLCRSTRHAPSVRLGASPRAAIGLIRAAQAHATLSQRDHVSPDDVKAVATAALAHRIGTDGSTDGVTVVENLLRSTPAPRP